MRAPATDDEWVSVVEIFQRGFGLTVDPEQRDRMLGGILRDRCLAVFVGDDVAAASQVRPFGIFLGGRSVPLGGYSPVAVAPEWRGRGFGTRITEAHFPALRERGEIVAGLYPASTRLYRGAGFEVAGAFVRHSIVTRHLNELRPSQAWPTQRRLSRDDIDAVKACYRAYAMDSNGWLDRSEHWWGRLVEDFEKQHWYGVDGPDGALAGYVRYRHEASDSSIHSYDISIAELCAEEPDVAVGLWKLVGSSSSQALYTKFVGGHDHPLLHWLPEQDAKQEAAVRWMARIIDAPAAVASRGYPDGVRASVDIEIRDAQCDWNTGRWTLAVEDGAGTLVKGGNGTVGISTQGLASLFTGYTSASGLRRLGLVTGDPRDARRLDAMFAGPPPATVDFY